MVKCYERQLELCFLTLILMCACSPGCGSDSAGPSTPTGATITDTTEIVESPELEPKTPRKKAR